MRQEEACVCLTLHCMQVKDFSISICYLFCFLLFMTMFRARMRKTFPRKIPRITQLMQSTSPGLLSPLTYYLTVSAYRLSWTSDLIWSKDLLCLPLPHVLCLQPKFAMEINCKHTTEMPSIQRTKRTDLTCCQEFTKCPQTEMVDNPVTPSVSVASILLS